MQPPSSNQPPNPYTSPQQVPIHGQPVTGNEAAATVIPYRNVPALIAYYCGVFSIIPCLGMILGPIAFILGIIGFSQYLKNPHLHGSLHAWVGIIVGGISTALHLGVFVMVFALAPMR